MSHQVKQTLQKLTLSELQELAIEHQLVTTGNKSELIERLLNFPFQQSQIAKTRQVTSRIADFLDDLKSTEVGLGLQALIQIINNKRNGISLTFYQIDESQTSISYLVAIKGRIDSALIELANSPLRVPRGLFCYWVPKTYLEIFGFLPKFENDREYQTNNQSDFQDANELRISLKASGSLGMRHVVRSPLTGHLLTFYTSKKATDNPYSLKFQELTEDRFTDQELHNLDQWQVENGFTLCAEVCFENNHGAIVVAPNFFVTVISQAKKIDLKTGKVTGAIGQPLVEYLPDQVLVEVCHKYNIPIDDRIIVESVEHCQIFIELLNQNRDFMTLNSFYQIVDGLTKRSIIRVIKGTLAHQVVFGQDGALEGLIIKVSKATTTEPATEPTTEPATEPTTEPVTKEPAKALTKSSTIKYKFPNYTCRTFGVRSAINLNPIEYRHHTKNYLKRWVLTNEGREYWGPVLYGAYQQMPNTSSELTKSVNEWIDEGGHILAVDWGITHPVAEVNFLKPAEYAQYDASLVIVLGPVGSGKTTIARSLEVPGYNAIDGDQLMGLSLLQTMQLGQERTPVTVWEVIRDLIKYQLAIVSTGGGAFKNILQIIKNFLPNSKIHLTVVIPNSDLDGDNLESVNSESGKAIANRVFEMASQLGGITEQAILRRLESGEWQLPAGRSQKQFVEYINTKVNQGNLKFVQEFIEQANQILTFPVVRSDQFQAGRYQKAQFMILPEIPLRNPKLDRSHNIDQFYYRQQRLLVGYQKNPEKDSGSGIEGAVLNSFGHVTEEFNQDSVVESAIKIDKPIYNDARWWRLVTFNSGKMCLLVPPDDHPMFEDLPYAHVTIKSVGYYPMFMKNITKALKEGQETIEIRAKSGELVTHSLPPLNSAKLVPARIIGRFYL